MPHPPSSSRSDRRQFLRAGAVTGFGLAVPGFDLLALGGPARPARHEPRADAVIQIFLEGGLSQIDSLDPKPEAAIEVRGEFGTVTTALSGERFSELLKGTAAVADRLTVIRSFTHGEAAHERGTHNMLTGYRPSPAITYPSMGSVVAHELGNRNHLPAYVAVPDAPSEFAGTGYLSSAYAPFSLGSDPGRRRFRVRDLAPPDGVDDERQRRRRKLLHDLDRDFPRLGDADTVAATEAFYEQAYALIESPEARAAFDLSAESGGMRARYGRSSIGQRLLLARRLVASGVRWVLVRDGGYDHHNQVFRGLRRKLPPLDRAFAALVTDLEEQGLLERTVVLLTTEFGRTPRINPDTGRDHWPKVFSVAAAGGAFRRGYVHGASNGDGAEPDRDPVGPPDLAATVLHQIGIDVEKKLLAPGDRPIDIVRDGRVVRELLA